MGNSTVFQVGVRVIATHDPKHDEKYAPEDVVQRYKCTSTAGVIETVGRSIRVEHEDGRHAWWEPAELFLAPEQPSALPEMPLTLAEIDALAHLPDDLRSLASLVKLAQTH